MGGKVRIGFCGVGTMGQCAHLRNYYTLPGCEVAAIAEPRSKTAARVAERYGVPKVYAGASEMLAAEKLDAIVAAQPFTRHGLLLPELLGAHVPVFIEKPLASTLEAAERILAAERDSGTWIMVGYHKRSDPASVYARDRVAALKASGEGGRLKYIRVTMPPGDWIQHGFDELVNEGDEAPKLERDPPAADMDEETFGRYVAFVNYYIHQVNLVRFLLGESYEFTWADPGGVVLAGRSESGATVVIEMAPYSTSMTWEESVLVEFERGYVKLELPAPLVLNRAGTVEVLVDPEGGTPEITRPHLPSVHAMRQQAMNFIAAVRGEREPTCTATEALEDLKLAREYIRLATGN